MPTLEFETTVPAPLARVWDFHEDVAGSLPTLSPPASQVRIESADLPVRAGSRIVITARAPLAGRVRWVALIVEHRPPHAATPGRDAAWFVDQQEAGPFAAWRHEHRFEQVDDRTTRLVDRVTYRVPFGPLGWVADRLVVRRSLRQMFRHRHDALRRHFAPAGGQEIPQ